MRRTKALEIDMENLKPGDITWVPAVPPSLCYAYPMRPDFLAQLVVPRDLSAAEAKRLCAFIETLVIPYANSALPQLSSTEESK